MWKLSKNLNVCKAGRKVSPETNPASASILDFQAPKGEIGSFYCLSPSVCGLLLGKLQETNIMTQWSIAQECKFRLTLKNIKLIFHHINWLKKKKKKKNLIASTDIEITSDNLQQSLMEKEMFQETRCERNLSQPDEEQLIYLMVKDQCLSARVRNEAKMFSVTTLIQYLIATESYNKIGKRNKRCVLEKRSEIILIISWWDCLDIPWNLQKRNAPRNNWLLLRYQDIKSI